MYFVINKEENVYEVLFISVPEHVWLWNYLINFYITDIMDQHIGYFFPLPLKVPLGYNIIYFTFKNT